MRCSPCIPRIKRSAVVAEEAVLESYCFTPKIIDQTSYAESIDGNESIQLLPFLGRSPLWTNAYCTTLSDVLPMSSRLCQNQVLQEACLKDRIWNRTISSFNIRWKYTSPGSGIPLVTVRLALQNRPYSLKISHGIWLSSRATFASHISHGSDADLASHGSRNKLLLPHSKPQLYFRQMIGCVAWARTQAVAPSIAQHISLSSTEFT